MLLGPISVFERRYSDMISEEPAEKVRVIVSDVHSDLLYRQVGIAEQLARNAETNVDYVPHRRYSHLLLEQCIIPRYAQAFKLCKMRY